MTKVWVLWRRLLQAVKDYDGAVVVRVLSHYDADGCGGKTTEVLVADHDWDVLGLESEAQALSEGDARGTKNLSHFRTGRGAA